MAVSCLVYNPSHESLLNHVLSGSWNSNYWGSRPFDLIRMLNVKDLHQWLHTCQPETIAPLSAQEQNVALSIEVQALLAEIPNASVALADSKHVAYTVITTPVQSVVTGPLESEKQWETSLNA